MTNRIVFAGAASALLLAAISPTLTLAQGMTGAPGESRAVVHKKPKKPDTPAPTPAPAAIPAAPRNPSVGGVAMDASKTIVENASAAPNLTKLVDAVKAADLVAVLSGPGPFTVFAPTNEAFGRLDPKTLAFFTSPIGKFRLAKALKFHVVPGTLTIADLKAQIAAGGGTAKLVTVEGDPITATLMATPSGEAIALGDMNGNKSYIVTGDVHQSNGIVHVVNGVMFPRL